MSGVFAGGVAVILAVLRGLSFLLCGRAAGDVGAREGVVVDVVARAAGPGFALAVLGVCWGVGGCAAHFWRERRFDQAGELAGGAVRELVGRVEVGEHELVVAVAVEDEVVDDVVQRIVEDLLCDLGEGGFVLGRGGHGCGDRGVYCLFISWCSFSFFCDRAVLG